MLSKQAIKEFKQIFKEVHGQNISDEEAALLSSRLLEWMQLIYQPIPKNNETFFRGLSSNEKKKQ